MKKAIIKIATCVAIGCAVASSAVLANSISPDQIKISDGEIKTSLTITPGKAEDGKLWFLDRKLGNCLACHANKDMASQPFHGEIGPSIDGVAGRYTAAKLRAILVNAKAVFGDQTIMPGFYIANPGERTAKEFQGKTILSGQQIEDVIAYLLTLKK